MEKALLVSHFVFLIIRPPFKLWSNSDYIVQSYLFDWQLIVKVIIRYSD